MNLAQLRALVAVVDEGGFTPAAAALELTQSGVSHAIASLERELGLSVVARSRGTVAPTSQGEVILRPAREALHHVDRIVEDSAAARGHLRGRLRIAGFSQRSPASAGVDRRVRASIPRCARGAAGGQ